MAAEMTKTQEALSLQCQLEEIEALIDDGHKILDRMQAQPEPTDKSPESSGATYSANRCKCELALLNQRLANLADAVGTL